MSLDNSKTNFFLTAGALFLCLSFLFFSVPLVSAITWNIDFITVSVNNTIYWDGHPFNYLNLSYYNKTDVNLLLSGYVPYTGATGDVNLGNNDLYVLGTGSYYNSTLVIDGDIGGTNATLAVNSELNMYSCINLTEGSSNLGFTICNDGLGINRLVFANAATGFEYMWINRDTGEIYFNNDTVFTTITMENLTVTGDVNITGNLISGGNITADYFFGDGSGLTNVAVIDNDLYIYMNGSMYHNITYNLTMGDVNDINFMVEPGDKFIFGGVMT